jgi:hypothetical protein
MFMGLSYHMNCDENTGQPGAAAGHGEPGRCVLRQIRAVPRAGPGEAPGTVIHAIEGHADHAWSTIVPMRAAVRAPIAAETPHPVTAVTS